MKRSLSKTRRLQRSRPRESQGRPSRHSTDRRLLRLKLIPPGTTRTSLRKSRRAGIDRREPLNMRVLLLQLKNLKAKQNQEASLDQEPLRRWSTNARMRSQRSIKRARKLRVKISPKEASLKVARTRNANTPSMIMRNPLSLHQPSRSTALATGVARRKRRSTSL
jgi:hypothetical protein